MNYVPFFKRSSIALFQTFSLISTKNARTKKQIVKKNKHEELFINLLSPIFYAENFLIFMK